MADDLLTITKAQYLARREGPPGWADEDVKEDWEAWEEFKRERRNRVGDWSDQRREKWG